MFELEFRVDYIDTDAMGIVHHSSYCRWLERARVYWLESVGLDYKYMETSGYAMPLRRLELEYLKPLKFDDRCLLRMFLKKHDKVRVNIGYEIFKTRVNKQSEDSLGKDAQVGDVSPVLVSRAVTEHVMVKNLKPVSIPEEWRKKWQLQNEPK